MLAEIAKILAAIGCALAALLVLASGLSAGNYLSLPLAASLLLCAVLFTIAD